MSGSHGQCNVVNIHVPNTSDNINTCRSVVRAMRWEVPMSAEHVMIFFWAGILSWRVRGVKERAAGSGVKGVAGVPRCPTTSCLI
eukprot:1916039-Pyramimonas_sp.AAC.1